MKLLISAVLAVTSLGAIAADAPKPAAPTPPAAAAQGPQAPALTPEAFEKLKGHLLEMHADRIKVLSDGERCIKATKNQDELQKCIEAERAALMPKGPMGQPGPKGPGAPIPAAKAPAGPSALVAPAQPAQFAKTPAAK